MLKVLKWLGIVLGGLLGLLVLAVVFFHYVQGFFSATLSAIMAVISAAVALGYYETLIEGPLAGYSPNWMPALTIMGLFAVTYVVLRTLFDKIVPGQISVRPFSYRMSGFSIGRPVPGSMRFAQFWKVVAFGSFTSLPVSRSST